MTKALVIIGHILGLCCTARWALSAQQPLSPTSYDDSTTGTLSSKSLTAMRKAALAGFNAVGDVINLPDGWGVVRRVEHSDCMPIKIHIDKAR